MAYDSLSKGWIRLNRRSINRNSFSYSYRYVANVESFYSRSGAIGCSVIVPSGIRRHLARTTESGESFNKFYIFFLLCLNMYINIAYLFFSITFELFIELYTFFLFHVPYR